MITKNASTIAILTGAAILGFTSLSFADQPGFYVGGQLGGANTNFGIGGGSGLEGGIFGGYQFNPYVAAELGYLHFHNTSASWGGALTATGPNGNIISLTPVGGSATNKTQAGYAAAKGIIPLANGFSVYGKAGLAYVDSQYSGYENIFGKYPATTSYSGSTNAWRPLVGVGASYDITQNITADVSVNRIQDIHDTSGITYTGVGLSYYFGG